MNQLHDMALGWTSPMCSCRATFAEGHASITSCEPDHNPWAVQVSAQAFEYRVGLIEKLIARGYNERFSMQLRRWRRVAKSNGCFFRGIPPLAGGQLSAEMAMYLVESAGVRVVCCAEPEAFADYTQGKAILGLMQHEWIECDRWPEGRLIFPEELVASDSLSTEDAEAMFARKMDQRLLAAFQVKHGQETPR